jgi:UDP-N-acetylmuramate-alanine ligase
MMEHAKMGDAVVIMGAGSITKLADELAVDLQQREPLQVEHE